ncbi:hypothetical protein E2320_007083 [Naja naja]|nr:hypothetical protein E2320_007083 [Naja naja]
MEFCLLTKPGEGTPDSPREDLGSFESDPEDDPLPEKTVKLSALLDTGCTRCLINPTLVGKLGIHLWKLKTPPITFCQLARSVMGEEGREEPANFCHRTLGNNHGDPYERLIFIVAPRMEWPLVLGLIWLKR